MGAEAAAETTKPAAVANGKISDDGANKTATTGKNGVPAGAAGHKAATNETMNDDEIAKTLAAASEMLQAAHRREQQKKPRGGLWRFFAHLYPKKLLARLRDCYISTCIMAAEKGSFVDLVSGQPGMSFGDATIMSRSISVRREREEEEMLQASLSRQASIALSRQHSRSQPGVPSKLTRNTSTGMPGFPRSASAGIPGLTRNSSTGMPSLARNSPARASGLGRQPSSREGVSFFTKSSSTRPLPESNPFSAGRNEFLQKQQQEKIPFSKSHLAQAPNDITKVGNTRGPIVTKSNLEVNKVIPEADDFSVSSRFAQ